MEGISRLKALGFEAYQLEIYHRQSLPSWEKQAANLANHAEQKGLKASQFVAHFLLEATANPKSLLSDVGLLEMERVCTLLSHFPECNIITLPLAPFAVERNEILSSNFYRLLWQRLQEKLLRFESIVSSSGRKLAVEIVPGSLMGNTEGFLRMAKEAGFSSVGYNFDTGHAHSSKEYLPLIPAKVGNLLYGTHLKDNFGTENLALAPGKGSIPWKQTLAQLVHNGYAGSYDLEIVCQNPHEVEQTYRSAKAYVNDIIEEIIKESYV